MGGAAAPGLFRRTVAIAALAALFLAALGRFRAALALTLGAAVAIVSVRWLSDLVGRLQASAPGATARFDWKLGLKAVSRYAVAGVVLYMAVRNLPDEIPWLLAGCSVAVVAVVIDEVRGRRGESGGHRTA